MSSARAHKVCWRLDRLVSPLYDPGNFCVESLMPNPIGLAYAFAYALLMASTNIMLRTLSERLPSSLIIGLRAVVGPTLMIVPLALLTAPQDYALLTPHRLLYLCGSVIIGGVFGSTCSVIAFATYRRLAGGGPITNTSPLFCHAGELSAACRTVTSGHDPRHPAGDRGLSG